MTPSLFRQIAAKSPIDFKRQFCAVGTPLRLLLRRSLGLHTIRSPSPIQRTSLRRDARTKARALLPEHGPAFGLKARVRRVPCRATEQRGPIYKPASDGLFLRGWTFRGPRALRPLTRGATTNPERWPCVLSLSTLKEGSSGAGPPDFRPCPKSIAKDRVNSSRPRPTPAKEKPAVLSRLA